MPGFDPKIPDDEPTVNQWEAYKVAIIEGRGHGPIVEKYGVTRQTSWNWCNKVARYLLDNIREDISQMKVNILKRLEYIYGEAMQSHEKLKGDEVTTVEESGKPEYPESVADQIARKPEDLAIVKRRVTKRTKHGDPAFLAVALRSVEQMVSLYKHEMDAEESTTGVRYAGKKSSEVLKEQLVRMQARLAREQAREQARGTVPAAPGGGEGDRA